MCRVGWGPGAAERWRRKAEREREREDWQAFCLLLSVYPRRKRGAGEGKRIVRILHRLLSVLFPLFSFLCCGGGQVRLG